MPRDRIEDELNRGDDFGERGWLDSQAVARGRSKWREAGWAFSELKGAGAKLEKR